MTAPEPPSPPPAREPALPPPTPAERPPAPGPAGQVFALAGSAILVALAMALFGWIGGTVYSWIDREVALSRFRDIDPPAGENAAEQTVAQLRRARALDPDSPRIRMMLAGAYLAAARETPASAELYRQEALLEAREGWDLVRGNRSFETLPADPNAVDLRRMQADILAQAGDERAARTIYLELLEAVEAHPDALPAMLRATVLNNAAFLFLNATDPALRDAERGFRLAASAVKTCPEASARAAFLDTLALAFYRQGDAAQALHVQKQALARAPGENLRDYVRHYDLFSKAVEAEHDT